MLQVVIKFGIPHIIKALNVYIICRMHHWDVKNILMQQVLVKI